MIYGIGVDLAPVKRIEDVLERWGERFLNRIFTPAEVSYCARQSQPGLYFAARFAAKEAFVKALGVGMRQGIHWRDVEVERDPLGKPFLKVGGEAFEICRREGIGGLHVSLSHDRGYGIAMVVLERNLPGGPPFLS